MKARNLNAETQGRRERQSFSSLIFSSSHFLLFSLSLCLCVFAVRISAQETPPAPGSPKSVKIPAVQEKHLANRLTVAVVEKRAVPLVTMNLVVRRGASSESAGKAGLANLTASMLTKGTKTKSATEIAEAVEFLGGSINSGAGWNSTFVSITVTSDKVDQAMAILADVVLNPKFDEKELELLKSQTLDGLTNNLKQPSSLANYVASKYSFGEHPAGGTPMSIESITRSDVENFYNAQFRSDSTVLIFTGDITAMKANTLAAKNLSLMKRNPAGGIGSGMGRGDSDLTRPKTVNRMLVIDLPKSGQASVGYYKRADEMSRRDKKYFPAIVYNTVLGGGYSSRLNMEIRIKRGLSYGAGSSFGWRWGTANFSTRAQTKNESAPQVAELVIAEIDKMADTAVGNDELVPRKSVLTGGFGRNLETTGGLANALAELYSFYIPATELNKYISNVNAVTPSQIQDLGSYDPLGGDIIIVGDYSIFKDDLAKRFPKMKIDVIRADELDLSKNNLRK